MPLTRNIAITSSTQPLIIEIIVDYFPLHTLVSTPNSYFLSVTLLQSLIYFIL